MLKNNFLKAKMKTGKPVLGTWAVIPSAVCADIICQSGLDFLIIDGEHGPVNFETAQLMCMACESNGVSPLVRVGGVIESDILRALDIGAHGIHVPNITSCGDVKEVIRCAKYPPIGNRGFSPFTRAGGYSGDNAQVLTKKANGNGIVAVHVESVQAADQIDEILENKELDVVFLGIYDLSKSLGVPGQVFHPDVQRVVKKLTKKINQSGKYAGTIVTDMRRVKFFLDAGIRYVTYSVDSAMLKHQYKEAVDNFITIRKRGSKIGH